MSWFCRFLVLLTLALTTSGCKHSLSERLENTNSDSVGEQIISIELPSCPDGYRFKFLESEIRAFREHCDEISRFDLNLDEINKHRISFRPKLLLGYGDGMKWNVWFESTYTEATGTLLVLEIEDGGFQGTDQFYTPIKNFLEPNRQAKFLDYLQKLAESSAIGSIPDKNKTKGSQDRNKRVRSLKRK